MTTRPLTIAFAAEAIADLRRRLDETRWPDQIDAAGWDYGTDLDYLRALVSAWSTTDFATMTAQLNELPHETAHIDGHGIHHIHVPAATGDGVPLLLLHGWPSSFVQMLDIIPLLADPAGHGGDAADAFDVVVASLPGYGFSDRPTRPGMSPAAMAPLFHQLMTGVLGFERYGVRSSDLGAAVAQQIARTQPEALVGIHVSGTNPFVPPDLPDDLSTAEQEFVQHAQQWMMTEMAYAMEHTSKPQTIGYALNDSPVGLAAWIVEKFWRWSDADDFEATFTRERLITNLTIYWMTQTVTSSMRLYYEAARDPGASTPIDVPAGMLMFPNDMFPTPREWAARTYANIDRWTEVETGGHFPEWEQTEVTAADIRTFFRDKRAL